MRTNRLIKLSLLSLLLSSCLGIAKITDFEEDYAAIDFDKYAEEYQAAEDKDKSWTFKTKDDYYLEVTAPMPEAELAKTIAEAFLQMRYQQPITAISKKRVIAYRGLRANEWNMISAVYYQLNPGTQRIQLYISTKITQDITGGFTEKRSMKLGQLIAKLIEIKLIRASRLKG